GRRPAGAAVQAPGQSSRGPTRRDRRRMSRPGDRISGPTPGKAVQAPRRQSKPTPSSPRLVPPVLGLYRRSWACTAGPRLGLAGGGLGRRGGGGGGRGGVWLPGARGGGGGPLVCPRGPGGGGGGGGFVPRGPPPALSSVGLPRRSKARTGGPGLCTAGPRLGL